MTVKAIMVTLLTASILLFVLTLTFPSRKPPSAAVGNETVSLAYLISATKGDGARVRRLLHALHHPANTYLVHVDGAAPAWEQRALAQFVAGDPVLENVWIVEKSNLVTYRGPTMLSTTLHGMAILLRLRRRWDWFVNLSAADYPLVPQHDLLRALSEVPTHLNFIQHTSRLGWKRNKRGKPIVIDPGLYERNKSEIWWAIKQRSLPTAFKLYTGSAWTMVSRAFAEYCIAGWENEPRRLLMYYANVVSSAEGYFQTLICNSEEFRNSTVNHDLHYIRWDTPPKQHPRHLGLNDFRRMVQSNRPFARKFRANAAVLDKIDRRLLKPRPGPGPGYHRLNALLSPLLSPPTTPCK